MVVLIYICVSMYVFACIKYDCACICVSVLVNICVYVCRYVWSEMYCRTGLSV